LQAERREVSAIQPAYDLDRLTLAQERRLAHERRLAEEESLASSLGLTVAANPEKIVLYIPDSAGRYWEKRSIAYMARLVRVTTLIFRLEEFAHQFPLRFDPCQCPGLISINSIIAFDTLNNRVVWELDGRDTSKLVVGGTALMPNSAPLRIGGFRRLALRRNSSNSDQPVRLISTGPDPQLILPSLPDGVGFPLVLSVEMKLIPSS
jgi:hypothetical protein